MQQKLPSPGAILALGIVGLAMSGTVIAGLICSVMGINKAAIFQKNSSQISKQVNIGRGLSIAGLICSILMMIFWIVLILIASRKGIPIVF